MISPVCLVSSKRFFASTGHSRARATYYLGMNVALLAQSMYTYVYLSYTYVHHYEGLAVGMHFRRPQSDIIGISVALLAAITADEQ